MAVSISHYRSLFSKMYTTKKQRLFWTGKMIPLFIIITKQPEVREIACKSPGLITGWPRCNLMRAITSAARNPYQYL